MQKQDEKHWPLTEEEIEKGFCQGLKNSDTNKFINAMKDMDKWVTMILHMNTSKKNT